MDEVTLDLADLTAVTDEDLRTITAALHAERARRNRLEYIPVEVEQLQEEFRAVEGIVEGDAWRQPLGAHDAYPLGWTVEHDGKTWESIRVGNADVPGPGPSWREVVPEGAPPAEWVQPHGHNPYNLGDRVTYQGKVYESTIDGNVYAPGVVDGQWKEI